MTLDTVTAPSEVVTLCGSVRFAAEHLRVHRALSLQGHVVLIPALPAEGTAIADEPASTLKELHRRKIDLSDRVHVVNPGGYVGASTAAEIAYALAMGKRVTYEFESPQGTAVTDRPRGS
jgi:hypothetical protein